MVSFGPLSFTTVRQQPLTARLAPGSRDFAHFGASIATGVLTGAHDEQTLRAAGATHVLESVADLPRLVLR